MKILTWIKSNPKMTVLISFCLLIIVLLSVRNCSNNRQDDENTLLAVAESKITSLEIDLKNNSQKLFEHQIAEDKLWVELGSVNKQLSTYKLKYASIASDLATEIKNNHALTNDESVKQFVSNSGCDTIGKRSEVPICAIRYYNDIHSELKSTKNTVSVLISESKDKDTKIDKLNGIIAEKDSHNKILESSLSDTKLIIGEKDKQIDSEHKKYALQKGKTWVFGIIGLVLTGAAIIF